MWLRSRCGYVVYWQDSPGSLVAPLLLTEKRQDPASTLGPPAGVSSLPAGATWSWGCAGLSLLLEVGTGEASLPCSSSLGAWAQRPPCGVSWNASLVGTLCQCCAWTPPRCRQRVPAVRPTATTKCPLSTTAGMPSTGRQSRWPRGRWRQGCTPEAVPCPNPPATRQVSPHTPAIVALVLAVCAWSSTPSVLSGGGHRARAIECAVCSGVKIASAAPPQSLGSVILFSRCS